MTTLLTALLLAANASAGDHAWTSDPDQDKDGIHDIVDACPTVAEDVDGYLDDDGCHDATRVFFIFTRPDGSFVSPEATVEGVGPLPHRRMIRVGVDAGTHRVQAQLAGFEPLDTTVEIPGGDTHRVVLVMVPVGTEVAAGS